MKHESIIETAFAKRGLIPQTFVCACCGDTLHRDDHMRGNFKKEHENALTAVYGLHVCFGCADAFEPETECEYCGCLNCRCDDAYDEWREARV